MTAGGRENAPLREARTRRGWTLQDVADVMYQYSIEMGLPESKADGSLVGKWERGTKQPGNGYVLLLCLAYEQEPHELALPARPGVVREYQRLMAMRHMNRREAMRLGLGVGVAVGLSSAAWDRLVTALVKHLQPDHHVLDGLHAITNSYRDLAHTTAPGALLPAVQGHITRLQQLLEESRLASMQSRVHLIAGETAVLAGRLSYLLDNRGDADWYCERADWHAAQAGEGPLRAEALIVRSDVHSGRRTSGSATLALDLLKEAERAAGRAGSPLLRTYMQSRQAEELAALGQSPAAHRSLDLADAALAAAGSNRIGFLKVWDEARLAGYRGCVELMLDRPERAGPILIEALARTPDDQASQKAALSNEVANVHIRLGAIDEACQILHRSLDLSAPIGLTERLLRARELHQRVARSARWRRTLEVRRLDERFRTMMA